MTGYLVIGFLAAAALYVVLIPLRRSARPDPAEPTLAVEEAESKKRAALTAILDLETERAAGKLADDEFRVLRAEYESEAVLALNELDALGAADPPADDAVEAEIARIRDQLRS